LRFSICILYCNRDFLEKEVFYFLLARSAKGFPAPRRGASQRGCSLSRKRITPFKSPKRKVLTLQASSSKSCDACRLHFPARGIAAFSVAIRFASAPIIRCRSAHLVEVQPNFRLPPVSTMRRAQQAAFGKQSAAEQTSLAPHDSKARLRVVTTCRRFMAKPCTPHPTTRKGYATSVRQQSCQRLCNAQRVQLFELLSCNGGVKGQSPLRSLGGSRGPFSHVREWPPYPRPPARCRETVIILHNHNPHLRAADPRACTDQDIY